MTKHYCDRCGKETSRVVEVKIPIEVTTALGDSKMQRKDLCYDCHQELQEFTKALYSSVALLKVRML